MTNDNTMSTQPELDQIRAARGPQYWRSLDEFSRTEAFTRFIHNEFPALDPSRITNVTRRNFLQVMGASFALAGLTGGCARQPEEKIYPYVKPVEDIVPGQPTYYASAFSRDGYGYGVLVETHTARPTKIEGNPSHPASLGGTDAFMQASVLDMYDPDRSQVVRHYGVISNWASFTSDVRTMLDTLRPSGGQGVRILTETVTSPTLAAQIRALLERYPNAQWHQYQPINQDAAHEGARQAFGEDADLVYHFDQADVIVSLDSNFFFDLPGNVRYARDWATRRNVVDHHEGEQQNEHRAVKPHVGD